MDREVVAHSHKFSSFASHGQSGGDGGTENVEKEIRPGSSRELSPLWEPEETEDVDHQCRKKMRNGFKKTSALWTDQILQELNSGNVNVEQIETRKMVREEWTVFDAMVDQGNHEVEVGVEAHEAATSWNRCTKNPLHECFFPVFSFTLQNLPDTHQDEDILRFVQLWSKLIVMVNVPFTSPKRPDGYPFHDCRGKSLPRSGTGKVTDVTTVDDTPCPCPDCVASGQPEKVWKAVWIMTAMHVVFDDLEAARTDIKLYFDDPKNRDSVRTLYGLRVVDFNIIGDWCKFECATHDLDLGRALEELDPPLMELGTKIKEKHSEQDDMRLAVVVSHPHGCAKQVTVGEWKERKCVENKDENYEWTEYTYTAATCKGSSGAPVWILGPERVHYWSYYTHVHSEGLDGGVNKSGAGDVEKRWDW